jgi:hypothetical protein
MLRCPLRRPSVRASVALSVHPSVRPSVAVPSFLLVRRSFLLFFFFSSPFFPLGFTSVLTQLSEREVVVPPDASICVRFRFMLKPKEKERG